MEVHIADPWLMYFDGAARQSGYGDGIVFRTPNKQGFIPYSFTLTSVTSNNEAEYEALIIGLELALLDRSNTSLRRLSVGRKPTF